jgi:ferric-dicitrate binding protein FerR (iron transport regulator)
MTEQHLEELVQKYADGTASQQELQQLMDWYHGAVIGDVHWPADSAGEKPEVYNRMLSRLHKEMASEKPKLVHLPWLKIAAAIIIIIGIGLLLFTLKQPANSFIVVNNPSGKIQKVQLPDSSVVWLNAATTLKYNRSFVKDRNLELNGEAYFRVTHDISHPFTIKAGGITTTVLGTSFTIKAYEGENKTSVSVTSGRVQVTAGAKELSILKPAMQLQFDRLAKTAITNTVDTNLVIAWKNGDLQFEGQSFADIAATLERWYAVKFVFTNPSMRNCRYYMSFVNTATVKKLLAAMAEITGMKYSVDTNAHTVTLSGTGCETN